MSNEESRRVVCSWLVLILVVVFAGCRSFDKQKEELPDTPKRGTIHISVDESFKPVIDQQVKVYESNNPGTHILVDYKPEAECLKDMLTDSVRMIISTRANSVRELALVSDSLKTQMHNLTVAYDAIAVIMHPEAEDSFFTIDDVKNILRGKFNKNLIPVFDGVKATSTVRFVIDSILRGDSLSPQTVAARSSQEVIEYISKTKNAVGFIGVSWIGNKGDPDQLSFLKKVKIIPLESKYDPESFIVPAQQNIYGRRYPLVRDLVYIIKEKHLGLGNGFAEFLRSEIGQLIFKRAYLVPAVKDFTYRKAQLNQ